MASEESSRPTAPHRQRWQSPELFLSVEGCAKLVANAAPRCPVESPTLSDEDYDEDGDYLDPAKDRVVRVRNQTPNPGIVPR